MHEIPQFALYGEHGPVDNAEFVHIETIEKRSRQHDWHIGRHTHPGLFQVLFLMTGQVRASMDDETWDREGPTVLTIHPAVVHGFEFSEEAQGYVLTVDQNIVFLSAGLQADTFAPLFIQPLAIDLAGVPDLRERLEVLLRQLIAESAWNHYGHTLMLDWLARAVLMLLLRAHAAGRVAGQSGRQDFELFSRFRALVEGHFRDQWQVVQYADALHVTPSRLNRLCLKLNGKSAFDMAQDRLVLEACRKLTYVPSGVASIAYELGFQDPAYFSRLFKKHTGMTPKEFRQRGSQPPADAA